MALSLKNWEKKMLALRKPRTPIPVKLSMRSETTMENFTASNFEKVLTDIVKSFVVTEVLGKLRSTYKPGPYPLIYPARTPRKRSSSDRQDSSTIRNNFSTEEEVDFGRGLGGSAHEISPKFRPPVTRGHNELRAKMLQQPEIVSNGKGVTARLGMGIGELKTRDYSNKASGSHPFNTWFLTVELGTGDEDNVGAGWALATSPGGKNFKDDSGDGSWWFGPKGGSQQGIHFKGKPGYFGLFDKNTRRPKELWVKLFEEEFPRHLRTQLADKITTIFG